MLDIRRIRDDAATVEALLQGRDPSLTLAPVLELDGRWRETLGREEQLRARQNAVGPEIARRKRDGGDAADLIAEMTAIKAQVQQLTDSRRELEAQVHELLLGLPNVPHPSVPVSLDKRDNLVVQFWGCTPDGEHRLHTDIAADLGLLDFERGAKVAGAHWPCYRGMGARLEWAVICYCIDRGVREGYEPILPPLAVNADILTMAGVLPKFQAQVYHAERDDLYLIPTAEIVLTGLYCDEILPDAELPKKMMAYTPCFRREAGTYGAEERGLLRMHQFNKIERYCLARPEDSYELLGAMTAEAQRLVQDLELHYRTTLLVTGDLAYQAAKTFDVEVWLPGQGVYSEVSSISNCEDYQARRGNLRYRPEPGEDGQSRKPELVHTLNGSALATSRLMVAILETYAQADGSVVVPDVLRPFMGGVEVIALS